MNGYDLSRQFFDWTFDNPEKITPSHIALYFFAIEHCNRLGWKEKFGLPTTMAKEAIGIKSYNTYIKALNDLIDWGFVKMVEKSKNQYSANIIALSNFNKAPNKALNKALIKHGTKQSESTQQSIDSIDKQVTSNNEQRTRVTPTHPPEVLESFEKFNKWIDVNTPNVRKLKTQINIEQFVKLKEMYPKMNNVTAILTAMHNYQPLTKKYVDVYLTLKKWLKRDESN